MKPTIFSFTIVLLLLGSTSIYGQDQIAWFHYFNKMNLSYKYSIDTDIGYRNDFQSMERWQIRTGLKYNLNEDFNIRAGIMHVQGTHADNELRLYQDFLHKTTFSDFHFSHRLRFEEQFFPMINQSNYRVRYNPMVKFSTGIGAVTLGVEPFINLNPFKITNNRIYLGITRYTFKNTLVTLQYIREGSYANSEMNRLNSSHMIRIKIDHSINPIRFKK